MKCVWVLAVLSMTAAAWGQGDDPFSRELKAAQDYAVQMRDPQSVAHGAALYERALADFPDHPRRLEAEYAAFGFFRCCDEATYLARADVLIRDVAAHTDARTTLGWESRIALVCFQTDNARHQKYEDLALAEKCLAEADTVRDRAAPQRARWVATRARLFRREEKPDDALAALLDYIAEVGQRPTVWQMMTDGAQYTRFGDAYMEVRNELMAAIHLAKGTKADTLLRASPAALTLLWDRDFSPEWEAYEKREVFNNGETFRDLVQQILAKADADAATRPATPPAATRPAPSQTGAGDL
jgi:hypothetical protein